MQHLAGNKSNCKRSAYDVAWYTWKLSSSSSPCPGTASRHPPTLTSPRRMSFASDATFSLAFAKNFFRWRDKFGGSSIALTPYVQFVCHFYTALSWGTLFWALPECCPHRPPPIPLHIQFVLFDFVKCNIFLVERVCRKFPLRSRGPVNFYAFVLVSGRAKKRGNIVANCENCGGSGISEYGGLGGTSKEKRYKQKSGWKYKILCLSIASCFKETWLCSLTFKFDSSSDTSS